MPRTAPRAPPARPTRGRAAGRRPTWPARSRSPRRPAAGSSSSTRRGPSCRGAGRGPAAGRAPGATPRVATVRVAGRTVGQVTLRVPGSGLSPAEQRLRDRLVTIAVLGGAIALVIAMLAALLLSRRLTSPLRRLTAAARRLEAGDLDARAGAAGGSRGDRRARRGVRPPRRDARRPGAGAPGTARRDRPRAPHAARDPARHLRGDGRRRRAADAEPALLAPRRGAAPRGTGRRSGDARRLRSGVADADARPGRHRRRRARRARAARRPRRGGRDRRSARTSRRASSSATGRAWSRSWRTCSPTP